MTTSRSHGNWRKYFYACGGYHQRGPAVCQNARRLPMEDANEVIVETLLDDVLDEYVSVEGAARDYGVVLTGSLEDLTLAVDEPATERLRSDMRP